MKKNNLLLILLPILVLIISCEKDETTHLNSNFRLKMEVVYYNNIPNDKTVYTYIDNQVDSIIGYENNFINGINIESSNSITNFEYNGNVVTEHEKSFTGNMVSEYSQKEYEFQDNLLIRYNDELFEYENGLLVEWTDIEGQKRIMYEYNNKDLIQIVTYRYNSYDEQLVYYYKYEFDYAGDKIEGRRYFWNEEDWILYDIIEAYYSNGSCIKIDLYYVDDGVETWYSTSEYTYNNHGDMIQREYYSKYSDEHKYDYYTTTYDENDNLIEVEYGDYRYTYFYERGETNIDDFDVPLDPNTGFSFFMSLFYNL
jgi:hypothetical protein